MKYIDNPNLELYIEITLKDTYLDLKYYDFKVKWSDKDTRLVGLERKPDGTIVSLSGYDLLLQIMNTIEDCNVRQTKIKVNNDIPLRTNLMIMCNQKEGTKIQASRELAFNPKEASRINNFFRTNTSIEII